MKKLIIGLLAVLGIALGAASVVAPAQAQDVGSHGYYPYGHTYNPMGGGSG